MSVGLILLVILVVILIAGLPSWPYAASWGYGPSGLIGVILLVLVALLLLGVVR